MSEMINEHIETAIIIDLNTLVIIITKLTRTIHFGYNERGDLFRIIIV